MKSVGKKGLIFANEYAVSMPIYFYHIMTLYIGAICALFLPYTI